MSNTQVTARDEVIAKAAAQVEAVLHGKLRAPQVKGFFDQGTFTRSGDGPCTAEARQSKQGNLPKSRSQTGALLGTPAVPSDIRINP